MWPDLTFAQLLTLAEYLAPLIVSLFAVWLGFYYQRHLADREKLRDMFLEKFGEAGEMLDDVELLEILRFSVWQLDESTRLPSPEKERVRGRAEARLRMVNNRLGITPLAPSDLPPREDGIPVLNSAHPIKLANLIVRRYNQALVASRRAGLGLVLGSPPEFRTPAFLAAAFELARVEEAADIAIDGLQADEVVPPDWRGITSHLENAQTLVFRLLGGSSKDNIAVRQYREDLPWPAEYRTRRPTRESSLKEPSFFGGPSFFAKVE